MCAASVRGTPSGVLLGSASPGNSRNGFGRLLAQLTSACPPNAAQMGPCTWRAHSLNTTRRGQSCALTEWELSITCPARACSSAFYPHRPCGRFCHSCACGTPVRQRRFGQTMPGPRMLCPVPRAGSNGMPMPGLFCIAFAPALQQIQNRLAPGDLVVAYLDDIHTSSHAQSVPVQHTTWFVKSCGNNAALRSTKESSYVGIAWGVFRHRASPSSRLPATQSGVETLPRPRMHGVAVVGSPSRLRRTRRTAWRAPLARRGTFAGGVTGHAEHTGGLAAVLFLCRPARQPLVKDSASPASGAVRNCPRPTDAHGVPAPPRTRVGSTVCPKKSGHVKPNANAHGRLWSSGLRPHSACSVLGQLGKLFSLVA